MQGYRDDMLKLGLVLMVAAGCGAKDAADDYAMKSKATEAQLMLNRLGKNAKSYFMEKDGFPKGSVPLTPATPCCKGDKKQCAPDAAQWNAAEPFKQLEFSLVDPHRFQYSYESDGKTLTATAVGDLDCDGTTVTYKLEVTGANGAPEMKITEPAKLD